MAFTTQGVVKITGLTFRQVDYWDKAYFIKPSLKQSEGRGSARLYSFNDLIQFMVAKALLMRGVSLEKMRKPIEYLQRRLKKIKKPLTEMRFLTDGETLFVMTKNQNLVLDTLSKKPMVFTLSIGEIVEELSRRVLSHYPGVFAALVYTDTHHMK